MPGQGELLNKVDINKNTNTDFGEIQKALDEGFFDKKDAAGKTNGELIAQALENREEELKFLSEIGMLLIDILDVRKKSVAAAQPKIAGQLQFAINTIQKNQSINSTLNAFSAAITYANTYENSRSAMMKGAVTLENIPGKKDLDDFVTSLKKTLGGKYVLSPALKGEIYSKIRAYGGSATSAHILEFLKKDILQDKDLLSARGLSALLKRITEIQKPARDLKNMDRLDAKKMLESLFGDTLGNEEMKETLQEYLQDAVDDFKEQKEGITSVEGTKDIAKNTVTQILKDYHGTNTNSDRWYENTAEKVAEKIAKHDADPFAVKGLEDLWKDLHNPGSGVKIDIYQIIKQSQDTALQLTAESILSDKLIEGSLEAYSSSLDALRTKNTTVNLYADILGTGGWDLADTSIESIKFRGKEMAIQIASIALSGGIAGFATRGMMLGGALGLRSATSSVRVLKFANNIKKYYLISKYTKSGVALANTMSLGTKLGIGALDLAVEGSLFHVANTMISSAINDIPWDKTLGELSHLKGYLQSVAYFGVLKAFSKVGGGLLTKPIKSLGEKIANPATLSMLSKGIQISLETASMTGTDTVINVAFGEGLKAPSREDVIHTFTIVVGLKLAHGLTGDLSKIENFEAVKGRDGEISVKWKEEKELIYEANRKLEKNDFATRKVGGKNMINDRGIQDINRGGFRKYFQEFRKNFKPGDTILELGAGEGVTLDEITDITSGIKVLGLDKDAIYKNSQGPIRQHDLEKGLAEGLEKFYLGKEKSLDYVYSFYTLQYVENGPELLNQVYQALKPGGKAMLHIGFEATIDKKLRAALENKNHDLVKKGILELRTTTGVKEADWGLNRRFVIINKPKDEDIEDVNAKIEIPECDVPYKGLFWKIEGTERYAEKRNSDKWYRYRLLEDKDKPWESPIMPKQSQDIKKAEDLSKPQNLLAIENSFKADYEKGLLTKEEVVGGRNLGIFKYQNKIFKVVKNKRTVDADQIQAMNERLKGIDNVFHPKYSFALKDGVSCIVMDIAPGKDAGTLTPAEIDAIPQVHWEKFEATIRELSKRGVQTDLTKRSNFLYDQEKGFQFLDINGISMDNAGTDKFFSEHGKEYYYAFEQYRFFPKEYISAKEMFLSISNRVIVVAEAPRTGVDLPAQKAHIAEIFKIAPELHVIGSQEQYLEYLPTVFPKSGVRDIVWHGSGEPIENFDKSKIENPTGGFFLTGNRENARIVGESRQPLFGKNKFQLYPAIINIQNPFLHKGRLSQLEIMKKEYKGNDALILTDIEDVVKEKITEYVVFEPSQIHVLGSKADVQRFKEFISNQKKIVEVFKLNPELVEIGSPTQYLEYLQTIFPESKIKDIVWHGSGAKFETFVPTEGVTMGKGIYFTSSLEHAQYFAEESFKNTKQHIEEAKKLGIEVGEFIYPVLLNFKSPQYVNKQLEIDTSIDYDGLIWEGNTRGIEYVALDPSQIHVLGSKADTEQFKEFVAKKE